MTLTPTYGTASLINSGAASGTVVGPSCTAGDLLLLVVNYGGGSPVLGASGITGGAGGTWTELPGFPQGGVNTTGHEGLTVASRTAAAGDSAATFTVNFSQSTRKAILWVIVFSDQPNTPTVGSSDCTYSATAGTALATPLISVSAGSLVLGALGQTGGTAATYTPGALAGTAAGLTAEEKDDQSNINSSQSSAELQDGTTAVTGAGTAGFTATSTASVEWAAGVVEVKSAAGGGGTDTSPAYATAASALAGGSGSWVNPGNADGAANSSYATWTAP